VNRDQGKGRIAEARGKVKKVVATSSTENNMRAKAASVTSAFQWGPAIPDSAVTYRAIR
jgi:hypothetical protein